MKDILKNYKFYVIIISMMCIFAIKFLNAIGVQMPAEIIQNVATYLLSALIAYNVITIDKPKKEENIKKDIQTTMQNLQTKIKGKDEKQDCNEQKSFDKDISHTI